MQSTGQPVPARTALPRRLAIVVGVLAVGAAVAVGHLIGGLIGPNASPYIAVANAVVQLTQGSLKELAVQALGTADKPLLLIGIGIFLLLLGILAGLLSRRSPKPGLLLVLLIGVAGFVAVLLTSGLGVLGLLAPLLSIVAGAAVFLFLHRYASNQEGAKEATEPNSPNRRSFLAGSAGVAAGALVAGGAGEWFGRASGVQESRDAVGGFDVAEKAAAIPDGADFAWAGTPAFITPNKDFYRVDTAISVPQIDAEDWRLRIHGMVEKERTYSFEDIRRRNLVEQTITMTCVSNEVGGPYISTAKFIGVPLRELLEEAGVRESADQLFSTSEDGYTAGTPVDVVMDRTLLAIGMNGEPLPVEHGFPVRMVTPGLYGYLSATKWVVDMELTTFDAKQGYWIPRGYSVRAPIKTQSRIDRPGALQSVPKGKVVIAGIAWGQPRGIKQVEVQIDDGKWRPAELSTEVSGVTWRMWRTEADLGSGFHTVRSRATDNTGYTQTDRRVSALPNGATGWPSIQFTVNS